MAPMSDFDELGDGAQIPVLFEALVGDLLAALK
jgi:hypothetical protein